MTEMTESFRPALYYPYIHIRSEDWLKASSCASPVFKRLIPDNYDPEDTGEIAPYAKITGPYGELLQRVPANSVAADQAQQELFSKIRGSLDTIKKAYGRAKAPTVDAYWIHDAKFSGIWKMRAWHGRAPIRTRMAKGTGMHFIRLWAKQS